MKSSKFRYRNLFLYASLQFCGNIEEYFAKNTQKLVVFIVQPRIKNKGNLLHVYSKRKMIEEKQVQLSENIFLYYLLWYFNYIKFIFTYFSKQDNVIVITSHPISFFGMTVQKLFLNVRFFFWIEYFPRVTLVLRLFDNLKRFYHNRADYVGYFGDRLNRMMNGKVVNTETKKTILWGVKPKVIRNKIPSGKLIILFVGIVKESQGLDIIFEFLKVYKNYRLNIIGVCDRDLYDNYQKIFRDYNIKSQICFPNRFVPDKELEEISKDCFVGIAPYTTGKTNGVYYIDPGKIKACTEFGLPVIMSNTSSIVSYVKRFKAGEVIERNVESLFQVAERIKKNYKEYLEGIKNFNAYFYYENYYKKKFKCLEESKP